jgi:hypothetical protein
MGVEAAKPGLYRDAGMLIGIALCKNGQNEGKISEKRPLLAQRPLSTEILK